MREAVTVSLFLHTTTDRAILVSEGNNRLKALWLPLSQVAFDPGDGMAKVIEITMPEWLALEKGLI